ncbi:MAG: FecR domain-containing protein [Planctomycetota bacterium]|nr:FecR domain-containing protein [Planctomycetota bacterium]
MTAWIIFFLSGVTLFSQDSSPSKTEQQPVKTEPGREFLVNVKEAKGTVEVCPAGKGEWVQAVAGMRFGEGSKVSTGFKSAVLLEFEDSSVVLLKDLTQVTVDRLFKTANAVEAGIRMDVGRVRVFVKKQEIRTDFRVSTPRLTAAVKGTLLDFETSPDLGDTICAYSGSTALLNLINDALSVVAGDRTNDTLIAPLDFLVLEQILGMSPDGRWEYESFVELQEALAQQIALTAGDLGTGLGQPSLDNDNATAADLPAFGGNQFLSELDTLGGLGYTALADYLRNGGSPYDAAGELSSFESYYCPGTSQNTWVFGLINSSQYGPSLLEEYGGGGPSLGE